MLSSLLILASTVTLVVDDRPPCGDSVAARSVIAARIKAKEMAETLRAQGKTVKIVSITDKNAPAKYRNILGCR